MHVWLTATEGGNNCVYVHVCSASVWVLMAHVPMAGHEHLQCCRMCVPSAHTHALVVWPLAQPGAVLGRVAQSWPGMPLQRNPMQSISESHAHGCPWACCFPETGALQNLSMAAHTPPACCFGMCSCSTALAGHCPRVRLCRGWGVWGRGSSGCTCRVCVCVTVLHLGPGAPG
jgi:hypothetical protein